MRDRGWLADTRASYDTVAVSYADQLRGALAGAASVRAVLALFADLVRSGGGGPVADVGCGPGFVTRTCASSASTPSGSTSRPR